MKRITIVVYGSLGDLHPAIALARGLNARGYEAAIATSEPYRAKVAAFGITFHAVRPDLSLVNDALVQRVMDGVKGSEFLMRELVYPAVRDMYADLVPIAANSDLLLGSELATAVPIVAQKRGVRWAYFSLSPFTFLSVTDPPIIPGPPLLHLVQSWGPNANRFVHVLARMASYSWWKPVRTLRRELGLPAGESPIYGGKYSPLLNLALFSKVLQAPQPDWPNHTAQTGFLFHDEDGAAPAALPPPVEQFIEAGPPPIVFTLGSAAVHLARDFYTVAAQAAQRLNRRAVLLLGKNPTPSNLPPSIFAWDYLPYAQIFSRAAAIVHQGGVGTTAQALRSGRPMLVMPFAHDQFDNAARVTRLGVARQIAREKFTTESAARELDALLGDRAVSETAATIGAQIRAERGVDETCEAIERALAAPYSAK